MFAALDPLDRVLIDDYQRAFPLVERPYRMIGADLDIPETEVIRRYDQLIHMGLITRIGAALAPNTLGASTLAAMTVPAERIEDVAETVSAEHAVNHNYERLSGVDSDPNLWFVVTGDCDTAVERSMARIEGMTGLKVLDLRLVEAFHLDLGFRLSGRDTGRAVTGAVPPDRAAIEPGDTDLMTALEDGLPLVAHPFAAVGDRLGWPEARVLGRIQALVAGRIIRRFGVIARHRKLGYRANAMCVWDIPDDVASPLGRLLAREEGVTLCYSRRRAEGWPFNLYCMVHATSCDEAMAVHHRLDAIVGTVARGRRVLFSTRCFKQTGARLSSAARSAA